MNAQPMTETINAIDTRPSSAEWGPIARSLLQSKFGAALIVIQVALTLAIIANMAPIVIKKVQNAMRPSGIVDQELVVISTLNAGTMEEVMGEDLTSRAAREYQIIKTVAGVRDATLMNSFSNSQSGWSTTLYPKPGVSGPNVARYFADDKTLQTLGATVIAGRNFTPQEILVDNANANYQARQLIITDSLARQLFPKESAVGKRVGLGGDKNEMNAEIIGVVSDVSRPWTGFGEYYFSVFEPVRNAGFNLWLVRTESGKDPGIVGQAVMDVLAKADRSTLYGTDFRTVSSARKDIYAGDLLSAGMLSTFALLVSLITAFGMIGLTSFWITQRTRQIGIRRSLGATQSDIKRYFRYENLFLTGLGCVLGILLSYTLNYVLARELDATTLPLGAVVAGALFLLLMGQLAVHHLAARAASISPALATRTL